MNQQETPANERMSRPDDDAPDDAVPMASPVDGPASVGALGQRLVEAREARGLTQIDVAQRLKLSSRQLDALERGDWDTLPGKAFLRGVLRAYGRLVDVDVTALLDRVGVAADVANLKPSSSLDTPMPQSGAFGFAGNGRGSLATWIVLALAVVVALGLFFGRSGDVSEVKSWIDPAATATEAERAAATDRSDVLLLPSGPSGDAGVTGDPAASPAGSGATPAAPVAPVTPAAPGAPAVALPGAPVTPAASMPASAAGAGQAPQGAPIATPQTVAPATGGAPAGAAAPLRLSAVQDAWVEVRQSDGKVVFTDIVRAGATAEVSGTEPLSLVVGNANQVRLEYRGRAVEMQPGSNNIARIQLP